MVTISHVLEPLVDSVAKYAGIVGQVVSTFYHPDGIGVRAKTAPLISDLEASRKVSGFLTHMATMFCAFCLCTKDQIEDLNFSLWKLRNGAEVRAQAQIWLNILTKSGREDQARATGVRWTPLHRLPYWDPVKHVVLGFMHNWLEGILQHQLQDLWGIGQEQEEKAIAKEVDVDEQWTDTDISESADELDELHREANEYNESLISAPSTPPMSHSPSPMLSSHSSSSTTPLPDDHQRYPFLYDEDNEDEDDVMDDDYALQTTNFHFTETELQAIRNCISNVTIPTWVQRPPTNLGEKIHGKLKAHEYLSLFTCILPLIIPELWYSPTATELHRQHLYSFHHLVSATHIISSFKTSNAAADSYTYHYKQYRQSIQTLFPQHSSKPNHHYAMHNGPLLKYWGPLAAFSEFPGERMNGMFQKIKTNKKFSKSYINKFQNI